MRWWLAALFAVLLAACSATPPPAPVPAPHPGFARAATELTTGWQFHFDDKLTPEAAAALPAAAGRCEPSR